MMIKCHQCDEEMFLAKINSQYPGSLPVMLCNRGKGLFSSEYKTELLCYVCPKCGHIELYAKEPQKLIIREK